MSKVIHVSDKAHAMAKTFCMGQGFHMGEWVATLIANAIARGDSTAETMRSFVLFLPTEAHNLAKTFCRDKGLSVNEWLSSLIHAAASRSSRPKTSMRPVLPKQKRFELYDELPQTNAEGVPLYAGPPWWVKPGGP